MITLNTVGVLGGGVSLAPRGKNIQHGRAKLQILWTPFGFEADAATDQDQKNRKWKVIDWDWAFLQFMQKISRQVSRNVNQGRLATYPLKRPQHWAEQQQCNYQQIGFQQCAWNNRQKNTNQYNMQQNFVTRCF